MYDNNTQLREQSNCAVSLLVTDIVLFCNHEGTICFANPVAFQWQKSSMLEGTSFLSFILETAQTKAEHFFAAACHATPHQPTDFWELPIGTLDHYAFVAFRGFQENDTIMVVGKVEDQAIRDMQHELIDLTSELTQTQRDLRRQNHALQTLLQEQQQLLRTIEELAITIIPLWQHALLVPLIGQISTERALKMTDAVLHTAHTHKTLFVIFDMSSIALVDTQVAYQLVATGQALTLIGATPVLAGINPSIAEIITQLDIHLDGFIIRRDLHHALAFVIRQLRKES